MSEEKNNSDLSGLIILPPTKEDLKNNELATQDHLKTQEMTDYVSQDFASIEPDFSLPLESISESSANELPSSFDSKEFELSLNDTSESITNHDEIQSNSSIIDGIEIEDIAVVTAVQKGLDQIRDFSDELVPVRSQVTASYAFSVYIEGPMTESIQSKILELVSHLKIDLRSIDLEPQFESSKVLIPRISEYAGIYLIQNLRTYPIKLRLFPSDSKHNTSHSPLLTSSLKAYEHALEASNVHQTTQNALQIPISPQSIFRQGQAYEILDTLQASLTLDAHGVESKENQKEFEEALARLKKEMQYRAYHLEAQAILQFSVQLIPLPTVAKYKLIVQGIAIKEK